MIKPKWFLLFAGCVLLVLSANMTMAVVTFDAEKYHEDIAAALSRQLGHTVQFDGPLKLAWSPAKGLKLAAGAATVANPSWASRPMIANIGTMALGLRLLPFLYQRVSIRSLDIDGADIQFEENKDGQQNYVLLASEEAATVNAVTSHIRNIEVTNSHAALLDKEGKLTKFTVQNLSLSQKINRGLLYFAGGYNDMPATLSLATGTFDRSREDKWPFVGDVNYAGYRLQVQGTISRDKRNAKIRQYLLTIGTTNLHGQMEIMWGGARPFVRGTVIADHADPADFNLAGFIPAQKINLAPGAQGYLFSAAPFDFHMLKMLDAKLGIAIDDMPFKYADFRQITATLGLNSGELLLAPVQALLAQSTVDGQLRINASHRPAEVSVLFYAPDIDLSLLLPLGGAEAFLTGKSSANLSLTTTGDSLHQFAGNANGNIDLVAAGNTIVDDVQDRISSGLADILTTNAGGNIHSNMKCLIAHFKVAGGIGFADKLFADTGYGMMTGAGGFNLHNETVDIVLHAKTQGGVDVGGLMPSLRISGALLHPVVASDTSAILPNISNLVAQAGANIGDMDQGMDTASDAEQKACSDVLDHQSQARGEAQQGLVQKWAMKIHDVLKGFTRQFLTWSGP